MMSFTNILSNYRNWIWRSYMIGGGVRFNRVGGIRVVKWQREKRERWVSLMMFICRVVFYFNCVVQFSRLVQFQ